MAFKKSKATEETKEINYEVQEDFGGVPTSGGYELKVRYISWNGKEPKYDIRAWKTNEDGTETCRKGLTLTGEQAEGLYNILKKIAK